jgi:hypothetical protein
MSLDNPPAFITGARDMLLACAKLTALGVATGNIHYPAASIDPEAGTADTLPCIVLSGQQARDTYAAGAAGLPSGTVTATLYRSAQDRGTLETDAATICAEMMALATGLPITSATYDDAQDPSAGMRANGLSVYSVTMTFDWGIS